MTDVKAGPVARAIMDCHKDGAIFWDVEDCEDNFDDEVVAVHQAVDKWGDYPAERPHDYPCSPVPGETRRLIKDELDGGT